MCERWIRSHVVDRPDAWEHPKFRDLTLCELGAWLVLRAEADLLQTDRFADRREALMLLSRHQTASADALLDKLVAVRLLDELEDGAILIHDLADHHRRQYASDSPQATRSRKSSERSRKRASSVTATRSRKSSERSRKRASSVTNPSRGVTSGRSSDKAVGDKSRIDASADEDPDEKVEKNEDKIENPDAEAGVVSLSPVIVDGSSLPPARPDVGYLRSVGWRQVTPRQVQVLDEIASNERRSERDVLSGQQWCADVMAQAPIGEDPLAHLISVENTLKAERSATAEAAERKWRHLKAREESVPRSADV